MNAAFHCVCVCFQHGVALDIPFVDDSSGAMVNGVPMGRPATPPVIRIIIPEAEVREPEHSPNGK